MPVALIIIIGLIAYVCGLVIIVKATPYVTTHTYDEGAFMGVAILEVLGGIFIFAGVAAPLALLTGSSVAVWGGRILAFCLLVGILIVGTRTALHSFRRRPGTYGLSRALAGTYSLLLLAAAVFCLILLFQPTS